MRVIDIPDYEDIYGLKEVELEREYGKKKVLWDCQREMI